MTEVLTTSRGDEVRQIGPVLPSGRVLVQHESGGLVEVVDVATLTRSDERGEGHAG